MTRSYLLPQFLYNFTHFNLGENQEERTKVWEGITKWDRETKKLVKNLKHWRVDDMGENKRESRWDILSRLEKVTICR